MKRSERFKRIVALQQLKEQEKARSMVFIEQQLRQDKKKHEHIQNYDQEYRETMHKEALTGASGDVFAKYVLLINQLSEMMNFQKHRIQQSQMKWEILRQAWQVAHQQLKIYERLVEKAQQGELKEEEKRIQKEQDNQRSKSWTRFTE